MAYTYLGNVTTPVGRTAINDSLNNFNTFNASATAPAAEQAYTAWLNTSGVNPSLDIRNGADTAYVPIVDYLTDDISNAPFVLDEDDMVSDSDEHLTTQQALKAYTNSQRKGGNWIILEDRKSSGTDGGSYNTSGSTITRDLNTETNDPNSNASISSDQFTLLAGDYGALRCWSKAYDVGEAQISLYDVTNTTYLVYGLTTRSDGAHRILTLDYHLGNLAVDTTFEIRFVANDTNFGDGLGEAVQNAISPPTPASEEMYTQIAIEDLN